MKANSHSTAGSGTQQTRPTVISILAVLNWIVGIGGVILSPYGLLVALAGGTADGDLPGYLRGLSFYSAMAAFYTSVLLLGAGFGLMRMKMWGWWLSVSCAIFSLATFLISRGLLLWLSLTASTNRAAFGLMLAVGTALLCLPSFVYPIVTLFALLPRQIRQTFRFAPGHEEEIVHAELATPEAQVLPSARQRTSALEWILHGPALPPYQSSSTGDHGWKWTVWLAPVTFAVLLLLIVGTLARFKAADAPSVLMGILSLIAGSLSLAGALFEWTWFFNNRSARGVRWWLGDSGARIFYVSVSACVLLLGFHLIASTASPSMIAQDVFGVQPQAVAGKAHTSGTSQSESSNRTQSLGGSGGSTFEMIDPGNRPLLGVHYQVGDWNGQKVLVQLKPIFERNAAETSDEFVMARDGYRVGSITVNSSDFVHAIRLTFVPLNEMDKPTYQSDWIGYSSPVASNGTLGANGKPIVGFHGRRGIVLDAIGLVWQAD